jgi:hypothetical protein
MRDPNGFDLVSFLLQIIQVCPIIGAVVGTLTADVWLVRTVTLLLLAGSWIAASRVSRPKLWFRRREFLDEHKYGS